MPDSSGICTSIRMTSGFGSFFKAANASVADAKSFACATPPSRASISRNKLRQSPSSSTTQTEIPFFISSYSLPRPQPSSQYLLKMDHVTYRRQWINKQGGYAIRPPTIFVTCWRWCNGATKIARTIRKPSPTPAPRPGATATSSAQLFCLPAPGWERC